MQIAFVLAMTGGKSNPSEITVPPDETKTRCAPDVPVLQETARRCHLAIKGRRTRTPPHSGRARRRPTVITCLVALMV